MPERKISFFWCWCHCRICPQRRRSGNAGTTASLRVLSTAIKQQKGSPCFITALQTRGDFSTRFSPLFIFPSLKINYYPSPPQKKIMLKGSGLVSGAAGAGASPSQRLRPERSVSPRAIANLCLGATLQKEQTFFFFPNQVSESLANTQSCSLPSLFIFWVWFVGFFYKTRIPRDLAEDFWKRLNTPSRAPGAAPTPCPSLPVFLPDSVEIIPQPAVVGLKCRIHCPEFVEERQKLE